MQCLLKEKLYEQASRLSEVSGLYAKESYNFVDAYFAWLESAEKELSGLRSPLCIVLQAEKALLNSITDGYSPPDVMSGKSTRRTQKAMAAQSLNKVSAKIYSKIESIDQFFNEQSEKLCHSVAVLAGVHHDLYGDIAVTQKCVDTVWKLLAMTTETAPMYHYFSAKLSPVDKNYILMSILHNIISNRAEEQ